VILHAYGSGQRAPGARHLEVKPGASRQQDITTSRAALETAVGMTAGTAIRGCLTIPGRPEQASAAREFVKTALGTGHPCTFTAVLLTSELVTNSVLHSNSRLPGQSITVTVAEIPGGARVEVRDAGGASVPSPHARDDLAEHGRGLQLVRDLSARWGYRRHGNGLVTWFEISAEPP
jgi:anti-sigma regulatory factor (Ser/Thr protein kinase)